MLHILTIHEQSSSHLQSLCVRAVRLTNRRARAALRDHVNYCVWHALIRTSYQNTTETTALELLEYQQASWRWKHIFTNILRQASMHSTVFTQRCTIIPSPSSQSTSKRLSDSPAFVRCGPIAGRHAPQDGSWRCSSLCSTLPGRRARGCAGRSCSARPALGRKALSARDAVPGTSRCSL